MNDDQPSARPTPDEQAVVAVATTLLEAYADGGDEAVDALVDADHDWPRVAVCLACWLGAQITDEHVEMDRPCVHVYVEQLRTQLAEEATLDELEAQLDTGGPKQPPPEPHDDW